METIVQILAREFEKTEEHVGNVVTLLDEGTPFPSLRVTAKRCTARWTIKRFASLPTV